MYNAAVQQQVGLLPTLLLCFMLQVLLLLVSSLFTILLHPSPVVYPTRKISSFLVLKLAVIVDTEIHKEHNLYFTVKTEIIFLRIPQWTLDKTDTELLHSHDSLLSRILGKIDEKDMKKAPPIT